ncbi:MAG: hypothetical protein DRN06_09235 [Thermoprotei archaeon]|nr:MAG: hypothetical protein DRN06_09235 [Thermoprotei archaeon]
MRGAPLPDPELLAACSASAFAAFGAYILACVYASWPLPPFAWLELWALGLACMAMLGYSRWVQEHQWGVLVAGFVGGLGTVGGLLSGVPLVRSVAGFALTVAYWCGTERWSWVGSAAYVDLAEVKRRSILLSLAVLVMNAIAHILLPGA